MTLLFLGEQNDEALEEHIAEFVAHAASSSSIERFMLDVDYRGTLGPKDADVLMFNNMFTKTVKEFRSNLLREPSILDAYNSAEQYPEWTPHLTLGYPETPAHEDDDNRLSWVSFDRIAFWTDDYDGYEFRLGENMSGPELAMSGVEDFEDVLEHYGVPGMKWGRRKAEGTATGSKRKTKAEATGHPTAKSLSDSELRTRINRLQMEKQYAQLTAADVNPGKKIVQEILTNTAKGIAVSYAQQYARKGIDGLIAKAATRK